MSQKDNLWNTEFVDTIILRGVNPFMNKSINLQIHTLLAHCLQQKQVYIMQSLDIGDMK